MGSVKVRYYTTRPRKSGRAGYWQPTPEMREAGFCLVSCGPDGPAAWAVAEHWNKRWDAYRAGHVPPRWPPGSLGAAFDEVRRTRSWKEKKARTREDWERGWRYIAPVFGDVPPSKVAVAAIDSWYWTILADKGVREAHRAVKIWRALWQQAAAFRYCEKDKDPSFAIRRKTPQGRKFLWSEGEVTRLAKSAWRRGYKGLACLIAVIWETAFSPVDARELIFGQMTLHDNQISFTLDRAKTGRGAYGQLGRRATALVRAYLATLPKDQLPTAIIFRHRHGLPYSKDKLGDDFRDVRGKVENRTLNDMRRSVALEALAGGAAAESIAAKLANDLSVNDALYRTYLPVTKAAVSVADEARMRGRRNIRGTKV